MPKCGLPERAMKSFAIQFVFDPDVALEAIDKVDTLDLWDAHELANR